MCRTFSHCALSLGLVVVGLSSLAPPARGAEDCIPFTADLTSYFVDHVAPGQSGLWEIVGLVSPVGPVTGETLNFSRKNGAVRDSTVVLEGPHGDLLYISSHTERVVPGVWEGTFNIDGGTGRFEGASGFGIVRHELVDPEVLILETTAEGVLCY